MRESELLKHVFALTGAPTPDNPLPWATMMPTVTVGGVESTVYYAGLTPYFIGLGQIVIGLPEVLPDGATVTLVIQFGAATEELTLMMQ